MAAIEAAYRRLVKQHHPDVARSDDFERIKRLNPAREWLTDLDRRRRYDVSRGFTPTSMTAHLPGIPAGPPVQPRPSRRGASAPTRTTCGFPRGPPRPGQRAGAARLRGRAVAHAQGYTVARSAAAQIGMAKRKTEWQLAREAASVIARGKLGDTTLTEQVVDVLADAAGAIAIRDLLSRSYYKTLLLPWTWRSARVEPAAVPEPRAPTVEARAAPRQLAHSAPEAVPEGRWAEALARDGRRRAGGSCRQTRWLRRNRTGDFESGARPGGRDRASGCRLGCACRRGDAQRRRRGEHGVGGDARSRFEQIAKAADRQRTPAGCRPANSSSDHAAARREGSRSDHLPDLDRRPRCEPVDRADRARSQARQDPLCQGRRDEDRPSPRGSTARLDRGRRGVLVVIAIAGVIAALGRPPSELDVAAITDDPCRRRARRRASSSRPATQMWRRPSRPPRTSTRPRLAPSSPTVPAPAPRPIRRLRARARRRSRRPSRQRRRARRRPGDADPGSDARADTHTGAELHRAGSHRAARFSCPEPVDRRGLHRTVHRRVGDPAGNEIVSQSIPAGTDVACSTGITVDD